MENTIVKSRVDFISKVMSHMGIGLFITFATAFFTANSAIMQSLFLSSPFTVFLLAIGEFGLVIYLNRQIGKMSVSSARGYFYLYSALNGITFSSIFLVYGLSSVASVFLIAALMFVVSGLIGISTKRDLSSIGQFIMMTLIGIIVLSLLSLFIPGLNLLVSFVGVLLFSVMTAYDMQKIKAMHYNSYHISEEVSAKYAIIAALTLYLDFINLFLFLIRIFGRRD